MSEEEIKTEQMEPEITEEVIDTQEQVETETSPETPVRRRRKEKEIYGESVIFYQLIMIHIY